MCHTDLASPKSNGAVNLYKLSTVLIIVKKQFTPRTKSLADFTMPFCDRNTAICHFHATYVLNATTLDKAIMVGFKENINWVKFMH